MLSQRFPPLQHLSDGSHSFRLYTNSSRHLPFLDTNSEKQYMHKGNRANKTKRMHFLPLSSSFVQVAHTRFDGARRREAASQTNSMWILANVTQWGHPATCGITCSHLTHKPVQYKLADRLLTWRFKGRGPKKKIGGSKERADNRTCDRTWWRGEKILWRAVYRWRGHLWSGGGWDTRGWGGGKGKDNQRTADDVWWNWSTQPLPQSSHHVVLLSVTLEAVFFF